MNMRSLVQQMHKEFNEYKKAKYQEICGLEGRVHSLLSSNEACWTSQQDGQPTQITQSLDAVAENATYSVVDKLSQSLTVEEVARQHVYMEAASMSMTTPAGSLPGPDLTQVCL